MAVKKASFVTLEHISENGEWNYKNRTSRSNEIFVILSGCITIAEDFNRYTLGENEVFCCKKDSLYQIYNELGENLDMYRLSFVGDYGTIPKSFKLKERKAVISLLSAGELISSREGYPNHALDAFCELLLAELAFDSLSESVKNDTTASALLGWIEDNKHKNIKVMDAAEHFGLSEGYLTRTFREEYALNLKNYIDNTRKKYVCEQLEDTSLSLSEIAARCGFVSYRQLNSFMNYHVGMSPSEYRKTKKWNK